MVKVVVSGGVSVVVAVKVVAIVHGTSSARECGLFALT